jgi:5-methylcytosine-specific restriction endonuclease McrA
MPYKDASVRKAYHKQQSRKHYEANREEIIQKNNDKKKEERTKFRTFKSTLKCTICGFNHPAALDFHHEDPTKKEGNIHRFVSNGQFKKVYEEITKCVVLCANCHRIHHYKEKQSPAF